MSELLDGSGGCPVYHLYYHGGLKDGCIDNSYKPFSEIKDLGTGELYRIENTDHDHIEYVKDFTFEIHLYLVE